MIPIYINISENAKVVVNKNISSMLELLEDTCRNLSYQEVLVSIFPMYLVNTSIDRCIKSVKELRNMSIDRFERDSMSAIHEWALYHTILWWIEVAGDIELETVPKEDCIGCDGIDLCAYLNNVVNYLDFLFEDWDFLLVEQMYSLLKKTTVLNCCLHFDIEKYIELMPTDIQEEYKSEKEREFRTMQNRSDMTINIRGGQVNIAKDNATIYAVQNNDATREELEQLVKDIKEGLSDLPRKNADEIADVVDMVHEELRKEEPKLSRLRNCISLIAPMITIANGIPTLVANLQKLQEFIMQYVQ